MKYRFFVITLSILFILSCTDGRNKQIERLVKEWNNKEILFPESLVFTRLATDTVSYTIPKSDYKIVVFVDSVGCISCKLQLSKWKEFMNEVDSLTDDNVPFIFFFQSNDTKELKYILKHSKFAHPVCIDTEDRFNSLNHFPSEMMFQTFLVDRDNRVKVTGNPIHNLSVRELYLKEVAGIKIKSLPATILQSDSVEYHYGTVDENKTASRKIFLKNIGKEVFRVKGVTTSCDCMNVEYDWSEIYPGESAAMTVSYKAEEPGDFWRTITIYGNIPDKSITLDFWGTVRK